MSGTLQEQHSQDDQMEQQLLTAEAHAPSDPERKHDSMVQIGTHKLHFLAGNGIHVPCRLHEQLCPDSHLHFREQ